MTEEATVVGSPEASAAAGSAVAQRAVVRVEAAVASISVVAAEAAEAAEGGERVGATTASVTGDAAVANAVMIERSARQPSRQCWREKMTPARRARRGKSSRPELGSAC